MFDKDQLLQYALEETGLSDFGGDDFQEPLDRLLRALNTEAQLNEAGFFRADMTIRAGLTDRLRIVDYLKQHPEVRDEVVAKPVFIVGLPRTGTTALHHLMNQDSANRTLRLWEAQNLPRRPPPIAQTPGSPGSGRRSP